MQSTSKLVVQGLRKSYGAKQVVSDVSLDVESGEVVGLLGPNGAGKTTSFYMIVGLVPSEAGEIFLDGERISGLPIHRRAERGLSYLPQEASVFRKLSVDDNIRAVLELQKENGVSGGVKGVARVGELVGRHQPGKPFPPGACRRTCCRQLTKHFLAPGAGAALHSRRAAGATPPPRRR